MMNLRKLIFCKPNRHNGLTLVELLLALMILVIIFEAVVTFAFAIGSTNDAFGDTSEKQARVRYTTLRISELLRHCKLILNHSVLAPNFCIWRSDDNNDGVININELVYLDGGAHRNYLRICELYSVHNQPVTLALINPFASEWWKGLNANMTHITLIPECSDVRFYFDSTPPWTRFVSISFDLLEGETMHHYQVNATLRNRPDNLLDESGNLE